MIDHPRGPLKETHTPGKNGIIEEASPGPMKIKGPDRGPDRGPGRELDTDIEDTGAARE